MRIDPSSRPPKVTNTIDVESRPSALAVVDGAVWTAALAATSTHRGGTLRATIYDWGGRVVSDPASLGGFAPATSLVYDGLVAYRRAGGSAGTALVADLATDLPEPSPDGLTYRFRLRPNLRFSNGAPVTPEDVRASLARLLAFGDPGSYDDLNAIPGAANCADDRLPARARFERCDLSDGVETDAAARTITFHLTAAGPRLPAQAPCPVRRTGREPGQAGEHAGAAGHGPVHDQALAPAAGWAAGSQPALPRLVVRPARRLPRPDRDPVPAAKSPDRRGRGRRGGHRRVRRPDPVRRSPQGAVRRTAAHRPRLQGPGTCSSTSARRRSTTLASGEHSTTPSIASGLAERLGTGETRKPTCQMLPPLFPGYTPSCRFTVNRNPAGTWTGPDLPTARRLVAASGTRGMKVEFWGAHPFDPVGRYFRTVLNAIGYRATVRTFEDLSLIAKNAAGEPRPRPQLGLWFWAANSLAPFTYLHALVSCSGDFNLSRFCKPEIDAAMKQAALARGPEALERWRRVETALAAEAPTVPIVSWYTTSLTAERVDNYQAHPLRGPLLEQLWIK